MFINWICFTKSEADIFLYTRNLWNERLKPAFEYKFVNSGVVTSERLLSSQKDGVEIFVLELAGIQYIFLTQIWFGEFHYIYFVSYVLKDFFKRVVLLTV